MQLQFAAATPERWPDIERLFGPRGACAGCWCMFWRLPRSEWNAGKGAGNKKKMKSIVSAGREPGVIAYADGEPIGWCAIAPREQYSGLERSRVLARVDDEPVWSVTCLFVARAFRNRGVSVRLLKEAVRFARARGARIVEGYPVEPEGRTADAFAWTGLASAFLRAGFRETLRRSKTRPIMRTTRARGAKPRLTAKARSR
jgi:GNAT superfamily N-acetyltransferase